MAALKCGDNSILKILLPVNTPAADRCNVNRGAGKPLPTPTGGRR
jgi:hypothetical protein